MNSAEIKETDPLVRSERLWLHEIAYQLALVNEKLAISQVPSPKPQVRK